MKLVDAELFIDQGQADQYRAANDPWHPDYVPTPPVRVTHTHIYIDGSEYPRTGRTLDVQAQRAVDTHYGEELHIDAADKHSEVLQALIDLGPKVSRRVLADMECSNTVH